MGGRGDIVILGDMSEQLIANAATRPKRFVSRLAQTANHVDGEFAFALRRAHTGIPKKVNRQAAKNAKKRKREREKNGARLPH